VNAMHLRYPLHAIVGTDINADLASLSVLLDAQLAPSAPGLTVGELCLIGPRHLPHLMLRGLQSGKAVTSAPDNPRARAWGVYLPPDVPESDTPLLMFFRQIDHLGNRPVLVKEEHLRPGELVVVPATSEVIAAVSLDGAAGVERLLWHFWEGISAEEILPPCSRSISNTDLGERPFVPGPQVALKAPWLTSGVEVEMLFGPNRSSFQLGPMLSEEDHAQLVVALRAAPWLRREGEIYTQDSLDVLSWVRSGSGPGALAPLMARLTDSALVDRVARMCGTPLTRIREVYAYRLRAGERILVHADGTVGGQLLVRVNWLIQVPTARTVDLRFWNPASDKEAVIYPSRANCATVFQMGEANPHDVAPVPDDADADRINIVMTFGHDE